METKTLMKHQFVAAYLSTKSPVISNNVILSISGMRESSKRISCCCTVFAFSEIIILSQSCIAEPRAPAK